MCENLQEAGVSWVGLRCCYRTIQTKHLALAGAPGGLGDLGGRAFLRGAPPPSSASSPASSSALRLTNVSAADEGEFRCRVDFRDSPTANRRVQLRVVEPPDTPIILDASGVEISTAGPFREGFEMELQCAVTGGRPPPEVEWWLNGELIDASVDARNASVAVNVLLVATVTRELWGAGLECRARPSGLTPALARHMPAVARRVAFELSLRNK
ncbi:Interference hedgehog [Gryllus bimaculatus]|nr:Interference hedgehog [Gryllus bimaculatus]